MRVSGLNWVIGKNSKEGDIQDVSIETTAEGLNRIQIARDARDTSKKIYVVDRRVLPSGAWRRLLETEAFSDDAPPERLSEVRAVVEFETIPNLWGLPTEKTWGLPSGMESPWLDPIEMVGNELLLSLETRWVSGDAPVNIPVNNVYKNGKYVTTVGNGIVSVEDVSGETLGTISTDTRLLSWTEGVAGAASFSGGSLFIEPAKPPLFFGKFFLDRDVVPLRPGLYEYGENYLISSVPIIGRSGVGAIAFVKDPYPERWITKMFGRAYVQLISPANSPPLTEDQPRRISVEAFPVSTDFEELEKKAVTPYANKTGVFNAWDVETPPVEYLPRERPYDILVPFDGKAEDWGGHSVWHPGTFFPASDHKNDPDASFPVQMPYEMPDIPEMSEGTLFYRWSDSAFFEVVKTEWMRTFYKEGYVYFDNKVSPVANGIAKIDPDSGWNKTKVEWTSNRLYVNDEPALIEELVWEENLGNNRTWGEIANISTSSWSPNPNTPVDIEQFEELPPVWETGLPEGETEIPAPDYSDRPRTWGRILYERYEEDAI